MSKDLVKHDPTPDDVQAVFKMISSMFGPNGESQFAIPIFDTFPLYRNKPLYDEKIKFSYYGNTGNATQHGGIIIVCSTINEEDKVVHYGVSFCSPKDVYNKDIGKEIAFSDLVNTMNTIGYDKKKHHRINGKIFADMLAYGQYPSWAEKAVADALVGHVIGGFY